MVIGNFRNMSWLLFIAGSFGCVQPRLSTINKLRPDGRYENLAIQAGVSGLTAADVKGIYFYQPYIEKPEPSTETGPVTSKVEIAKILNAFRASSRDESTEHVVSKDPEMVYIIGNNGKGVVYYFDGYPTQYDAM